MHLPQWPSYHKRWADLSRHSAWADNERTNEQTDAPIVREDVTGIIGKGGLSSKVANSFASRCFYLAFPGGCGILAEDRIEGVLDVYYAELGFTEAVWKLQVRDFGPLLVAMDSHGERIYKRIRTSSRARLSSSHCIASTLRYQNSVSCCSHCFLFDRACTNQRAFQANQAVPVVLSSLFPFDLFRS